MASKVDGQQLQDVVCPLCLDVFTNPTLLSCGHTFCRECLESYDEQHHLDHIECPVCRKTTNLGQNRVAGLASNFLARDMQDKLHVHVVAPSQSFCPMHKNTHNDIFCEDCKEFICFTCFKDSHKDHKTKKREALEGDLKEKIDSLIGISEIRKAQIEMSVNNAQQRRRDTRSHFCKVERKIKDEFAKSVTILQQKEESLLNKLYSIKKEAENQFDVCIENERKAIDDINNSIAILRRYTEKSVDSDAIKTQYLQCNELEKSLKRNIDEASIVRLQQTAESTWFRPSDKNLLALGHIEVGVKEISNIQQVKTANGAERKLEPPARKNVTVIPPPVRSKSLNIVRQIDAEGMVRCMAAARSQDAVVVGYGGYVPGSDCFSVSGENTQHLEMEVGCVGDIAFLTDGRSVVSHDNHTLRVYSTDRHSTGMRYICEKWGYCVKLCVDQDDNIYAVNGHPEIYIFHGSNRYPQRVIPTGDIIPTRICVTKTGALITRTWNNTLTVFDKEGSVGSSITASDDEEYLFATVDSQDRVLVARVREGSDVFRLTRYTLQGTTLIQQVTFNEFKIPCDIDIDYCYMTSLQPKLIAFANNQNLYFIELDD